jgi:hypothetical protein
MKEIFCNYSHLWMPTNDGGVYENFIPHTYKGIGTLLFHTSVVFFGSIWHMHHTQCPEGIYCAYCGRVMDWIECAAKRVIQTEFHEMLHILLHDHDIWWMQNEMQFRRYLSYIFDLWEPVMVNYQRMWESIFREIAS